MKRTSTIQPTSGTSPLSFAAAAQKNTSKQPTSTDNTSVSSTASSFPQTRTQTQTQKQTQTQTQTQTPSHSGSKPSPPSSSFTSRVSSSRATVFASASASATTPSFVLSQAGPTPPAVASSRSQPRPQAPASAARASLIPSTANGNYSTIAAKANNVSSNKRSQPAPPTSGSGVKGAPRKPASNASPIVFGSINQTTESASPPAGSADILTFGSIPASKKPTASPVSAPSSTPSPSPSPTLTTAVSYNLKESEGTSSYKNASSHLQHSHRRTDSAALGHGGNISQHTHFRAQVPPTIAVAATRPTMGVHPVSASYTSQRPPIKAQGGLGQMNQQSLHHHPGMHSIPQWSQQSYYIPSYDTSYYQPMYHLPVPSYSGQPPHQPMATRPFNTDAPSFTPKVQSSKRITIIDPLTGTEVTPVAVATPPLGETKRYAIANVAGTKNAEDDNKPVFTMPTRTIIKIVNPVEKEREERERKEKEEQSRKEEEKEKVKVKERLEREEKERIECEAREAEERKKILKAKEAEEHRIAEEKAERERQEALAKKAEQERKEKDERDRLEAEKRFMEEKAEAIAKAAAEDKVRMEAEAAEKIRIEKEKAEVEAEERVRKLEKERAEAEAEEGVRKLERERAEAEAVERDRILEKEKAEVKIEEQARKPVAERRIELETEKVRKDQVAGTDAALSHVTDSSKPGMSVDVARTETLTDFGASVRIENFDSVVYPSHIQSPATDGQGKVRYDRDFLMQFMNVCTDKPESLPDIPGNEENGHRNQIPGSSQRGSQHGSQHGVMSSSRGKPFTMGSFKMNDRPTGVPLSARNMSGDARLNRSSSDTQFTLRANSYLSRPPSQRGSRGGRRGGGGGGSGRGGHHSHQDAQLTIPLADIVPLEKTKNAWTPNVNTNQAITVISQDETLDQEQVARKVKGLLNKLTLEKFDSISDKVIDIANLSANEEDGTTLKHCIQIIFEKATDEPNFGSVYARLCQKLMEKVSNDVKDNTVPGSTGGKLFRKYLLHRCQEEFVRGWKDKAASNGAPLGDKDGPDLMSDEYYIMMKAKRQGLGLIHFIGELFKLSMLTEKIMHECVKKLLANVKDPEEEEIEGLCKLMTTVGLQLDRPEAKPHIDVYFARMTELAKNTKLASRIRFMVQDVIDLRANNWVSRRAASGPKTIAAIHEEAARQQEEKELMRRTASSGGGRGLPNRREQLNRGQSFRGSGDARQDHGGISSVGADGWSTVGTSSSMTKKAGDLSSFGNTSRSKVSGLPSLGPSGSVFGALNKSKRSEAKAASQNDSGRTVTSVNSFSALEGEVVDRRVDVETEKPMERRRLLLLPRSTSVLDTESVDSRSEPDETLSGTGAAAGASANNKKTEEEAKRSIANTVKEFMSIKDMDELMISVQELDTCYRPLLVTEFVNQSMEMTQSDIDCVAEIFKRLRTEKIVSPEDFEAGFSDPLEFLPDTAIDVPNAYKFTGQLLEAAGMDPTRATT